jgi:hypothetical protein
MNQIARKMTKTKKNTTARAPKIWKKILRIRNSTQPTKADNVRAARIKEPVKKSFSTWAI